MFKLKRIKEKIQLTVSPTIPNAEIWEYYFFFTEKDEPSAQLLLNQIQNHMQVSLKNTRQEYYDRGYKDAKAKRKKCDWISGWW